MMGRARLLGACATLGLAWANGACSDADEPFQSARLGIEARDASGRHAVVGCEALPLLQGSRRYVHHVIDDVIELTVAAEPSQVGLSFEVDGRAVGKVLTIPRSALLHGYQDAVQLLLQDGSRYTFELSSECVE